MTFKNGLAVYSTEEILVEKIAVSDGFAIATVSGDLISNEDACSSIDSERKIVIDLNNSQHATYLYTHLMTAMISNRAVSVLLDGCVFINDIESLPSISSVEVIN